MRRCNNAQTQCVIDGCEHAIEHSDCCFSGFSATASYPMECTKFNIVVQCLEVEKEF